MDSEQKQRLILRISHVYKIQPSLIADWIDASTLSCEEISYMFHRGILTFTVKNRVLIVKQIEGIKFDPEFASKARPDTWNAVITPKIKSLNFKQKIWNFIRKK